MRRCGYNLLTSRCHPLAIASRPFATLLENRHPFQVRLKCSADGSPAPAIVWFKDGIPLEQFALQRRQAAYKAMDDHFSLKISKLSPSEEGNYTCVVTNEYGQIRRTFSVETAPFLQHTPLLVETSPNATVMEGMPARLRCKFRSDLATQVMWLRPKQGMTGLEEHFDRNDKQNFRFLKDPATGRPVTGGTLTIPKTAASDSGLYFCIAKTRVDLTPGFLHLTVLAKDEAITEAPSNVTAAAGADVALTCRTHLELHRHMSWVRLKEDAIVELAQGTEVLKIENVTEADAGVYACVVGTNVAHAHLVAHLEVRERLPVATFAPGDSKGMAVIAGTLSVLAFLLLVLTVYIFNRCRSERTKKKAAIRVRKITSGDSSYSCGPSNKEHRN